MEVENKIDQFSHSRLTKHIFCHSKHDYYKVFHHFRQGDIC